MNARPKLRGWVAGGLLVCLFPLVGTATSTISPYSIHDVEFRNGMISLAGRLYLPTSAEDFPTVIFTHGSGPSGKDNPRYTTEAEFLATKGIAVLLYDKRGVGTSTGDWKTASFQDLASDAVSAFEYLQTRSEIAKDKIGFRGASQSGYVLPVAASIAKGVAFMVLLSPPMVKPYEQVLFDVESQLRDKKFSDSEIAEALEYTRAGLDYAKTGKGWERYEQLLSNAQKKPWFEIAGGPDSKDDWMFSFFNKILEFETVPYLAKTKCPVLVFFAGQDKESPVPLARPLIEETLKKRGGLYRIVYYPFANHDLRVGDELAPGYLQTMRDWILQAIESIQTQTR